VVAVGSVATTQPKAAHAAASAFAVHVFSVDTGGEGWVNALVPTAVRHGE
jgi:hypothetical protein